MILGTAGHIDHGKTALVRALTGVDTDRLAEEKRRGITIELGFAPLALADGNVVSIVDVPGHERFVDTMTAGAWPLDAALLVVAATEGVMPQTREHCAILHAFGVPIIAVALTNVDRVAEGELSSIEGRICAELRALGVDVAVPVIPTVAPRGDGVEALRATIEDAQSRIPERDANDLARFIVDRSFSLRGIGTIATGTLQSGELRVADRVRILPGVCESRIRGIHTHGTPLPAARAGARYALALADVAPTDVPRGSTLVTDDAWRATTRIDVRTDTPDAPVPRRGVLHVAGSASLARVRTVDASQGIARLSLERPVVARAGDRAILRSGPGDDSIIGVEVADPLPERHAAARASSVTSRERLHALATSAGTRGVAVDSLPLRLGVSPATATQLLDDSPLVVVGDRVLAREVFDAVTEQVAARVREWVAEHPFAVGVSSGELGTMSNVDPELLEHLLAALVSDGRVIGERGVFALGSSELPAESANLLARVLHAVSAAELEPPTVAELVERFGAEAEAVVRHAERHGNLIRVGDVRCYAAPVLARAIEQLRTSMRSGGEFSPSELRDVLGVSRKYLIPLLEYCDSVRVTERRSGGRVLVDVSSR